MLILSVFPGLDFLGKAFEEELDACVVRGPDVIWGGDVRTFHPPAGVFDGVIGGPPCQMFSTLAPLVRHNGYEPSFGNLIPEYERVVAEAQPAWFVMEEVRGAPLPDVEGYDRWAELVTDSDVGGVQPRERRISFGLRQPHNWDVLVSPFTLLEYDPQVQGMTVLGGHDTTGAPYDPERNKARKDRAKRKTSIGGGAREGHPDSTLPHMGKAMTIGDMLEAQGMPRDYLDHAPFTADGKRKAIGNGVPLSMGKAIAAMVGRVTKAPSPRR